MARKIRLSPLQRDVLWTLEEAGSETLRTVLATLKPVDQQTFDADLDGLVRLEYIQRSNEPASQSLILTAKGRKAMTT
jgi:DNA-binding MarR family transcriptional regulator